MNPLNPFPARTRRRWRADAAIATAAVLLAGCASPTTRSCGADVQPATSEWIYFGTATPQGQVQAQEWAEFLRSTVTPRFPAGLTVWSASGQWRSNDGSITREPSYVLNLLHDGRATADADIRAIVAGYKARFQQEAVLRVSSPACLSL